MNFRVWALAAFAFIQLPAANAQEEEDPGFTMTVGLRETYDDNLYRLPEGQDPSVVVGPDGSRIDYLSRVSLGLEQEWQWSRQTVIIDLKGNHDAYKNNDHLMKSV
jgi:hypothetical protein